MTLQGKGWFIWQVPRCEGGAAEAIASRAAAAGLSHLLVKVAERSFAFGFDRDGRDLLPPLAAALRARGIQVWGWHYVYGESPAAEANIAVRRSLQLKLDGYVVDAEREFKLPGKSAAARQFMAALRAGLPTLPIALSSYRYPSLHPQLPWSAFLEKCDLVMPQVYWEQAHNPDQQLRRSVAELGRADLVGFPRPVVPTGAAYAVAGWRPTAAEVTRFLETARALELPGANFYSWDYAGAAANADLWQAVAGLEWPAPPARDVVDRFLEALNTGDPAPVLKLYQPNAGHVTARRTVIGLEDVSRWYMDLLRNVLPGARFTLVEATGTGNSRRFRWTAAGPTGRVVDGDDTLGLRDGLIQYHYTAFTLSPPA